MEKQPQNPEFSNNPVKFILAKHNFIEWSLAQDKHVRHSGCFFLYCCGYLFSAKTFDIYSSHWKCLNGILQMRTITIALMLETHLRKCPDV